MKQEYGLNYVSRRTFTHNGIAAMLAAGAAPAFVSHARADEPNKKLGMAVVGLGGYATRSVGPEIAACQHVRLAGVVTGDAEKGRSWAKEHGFEQDAIYSYENFDTIASDDRIEFVHIGASQLNACGIRHSCGTSWQACDGGKANGDLQPAM